MKPIPRLLIVVGVIAALTALFLLRHGQAAPTLAASYTGVARISGPLQLDLTISPPVGMPRDTLRLSLLLRNLEQSFASPTVIVTLPTVLDAATADLPAGATMNLATNSIQWLPVVPPNGQQRELTLDLKVSTADLTHPEQVVNLLLRTPSGEQAATTTLWIGMPPQIADLVGPMRVSVGQPLDLAADIIGPGPFNEAWDLGDGRHIPINHPTVVYPVAGVYEVSLKVRNPIGASTRTEQITVIPHAAAQFAPDDDKVGPGQLISFANQSGGQGPVRYTWEFGDGTSSSEAQPQHSYSVPGIYQVKLIAENAYGRSETVQTVAVGSPPSADIYVADVTAAGEHISGEAVGTDAADYVWSMGDGRRYSGPKVSHAFRQQGDYYITVTASNDFGSTEVGRWVHVEEGTPRVFLPMISHRSGLSSGSSANAGPASETQPALEEVPLDAPFILSPIDFAPGTAPTAQLLAYVNAARAAFGLPEVRAVPELNAAAQKHAGDMATGGHTRHVGSDGSTPADRFLQFGYARSYAGEATAWGFADPRQSVEFWVNSPGHRPILLNRYATDVGLGHVSDYNASSVWYWTAEFGNSSGAPQQPLLRLQSPADALQALNSDTLSFSWNWPRPLDAAEQFTLYFQKDNSRTAVATITEPAFGTRYLISLQPLRRPDLLGEYQWQIVLENNRGTELQGSETRSLSITVDPSLPTPTPLPVITPQGTAVPLPTITPIPTVTVAAPTATPRPPEPTAPPLVIATPLPTEP